MMEPDEIKCPLCHKDDQIQKVSAIVLKDSHEISGGSIHTQVYIDKKGKKQYEDDYVPYNATQVSALAQRLSAPKKPSAGFNWGIILAIGLLGFTAIWMLVTVVALLTSSSSIDASFFLCCCTPIIFSGGGGVFVYLLSESIHRKRVVQVEQIELPKWEKAMARWNRLYYCYRDDSVFIPFEDKVVSSSGIRDFIFLE